MIGGKVKFALKDSVVNELSTKAKQSLDNALQTSLNKAQCSFQSFTFNLAEHILEDMFWPDVIGETLQAQNARFYDTDSAFMDLTKTCLA